MSAAGTIESAADMIEIAVAFATDPRQVFLATVIALGEVKQERDSALARVAELETQRDNLQRCNNDYLERIRKAESPVHGEDFF